MPDARIPFGHVESWAATAEPAATNAAATAAANAAKKRTFILPPSSCDEKAGPGRLQPLRADSYVDFQARGEGPAQSGPLTRSSEAQRTTAWHCLDVVPPTEFGPAPESPKWTAGEFAWQ